MSSVKILKLIRTKLERQGRGTEDDPVRILEQYWDFEGNLVFEIDPFKDNIILNDKDQCDPPSSG